MVALDWQVDFSATELWQRQAITVQVQAITSEPFARLQVPPWQPEGMEVIPLEFTSTKLADKTQLQIGWVLVPHRSGTQTLQLPEIRYRGRKQVQKWQAVPQTLQVNALPSYIPPTVPVGKVDIQTWLEPSGILQPDHLAYWHVQFSSKQLTHSQFPPLLAQLNSANGVQFLPAQWQHSLQVSGQDAQTQLHYRIPFKVQHSGLVRLPELQWHWFDGHKGRLQHSHYQAPRLWVLAAWQQGLALLFAAIVALGGSYLLGKLAHKAYQRWRSNRRVWQLLAQSADPMAIRQAMRDCARLHAWPENLSTQAWFTHWQQRYGYNPTRQALVEDFERQRFTH